MADGTLRVRIIGDDSSFKNTLAGTRSKLGGFATGVLKVGGVAAAAAAGGITALTAKTADYGDQAAKSARTVGLSTEGYQELTFALGQLGLDQQKSTALMTRFNKRIGEAADGNQTYKDAVDTLGVSLTDNNGNLRDQDDLFTDVMRGLEGVEDSQTRAAIASDLFGSRAGPELASAIDAGADGIDDLRQRAQDLGIVMDEDAAQAAERFNDRWDDLTQTVTGFARRAVVPLMTVLADEVFPFIIDKLVPALGRFWSAMEDGKGFVGSLRESLQTLMDLDPAASPFAAIGSLIRTGLSEAIDWIANDGFPLLVSGFQRVFEGIQSWASSGGLDWLLGVFQDAFWAVVDWLNSGGIQAIVQAVVSGRERLFEAAMQLFPVLLDALLVALPSVVQWLANVGIPTLIEVIVTAAPQILLAAQQLFGMLVEAIVTLVPELIGVIANDLLPAVIETLVTLIPTLLETAIGLFQTLVDGLLTVLPVLLEAILGTLLPAVLELIVTMIPTLLEAAIGLFQTLVDAVVQILPKLLNTLLTVVLPEILNALINMVPTLLEAALTTFLALVDALLEALPVLIETLLTVVLPALLTALVEMIPQLLEAAVQTFMSLVDAVVQVLPELLDVIFNRVLPDLVTALLEMFPQLQVAGVEAFLALVEAVLEVLPDLIEIFTSDVLPNLVETLVAMAPEILTASIMAFTEIIEAVSEVLPDIINTIVFDVIPAIVGAIIKNAPLIYRASVDAVGEIAKALIAIIPDVQSSIRTIIDRMMTSIAALGRRLYNAGKNAVRDLLQGMKDTPVGRTVSNIASRVRSFWPFSPAKAGPLRRYPMDKAGANITKMLARGMLTETARVDRAASRLAEAARVTAGAEFAGVAGPAGSVAVSAARQAELDRGSGTNGERKVEVHLHNPIPTDVATMTADATRMAVLLAYGAA